MIMVHGDDPTPVWYDGRRLQLGDALVSCMRGAVRRGRLCMCGWSAPEHSRSDERGEHAPSVCPECGSATIEFGRVEGDE